MFFQELAKKSPKQKIGLGNRGHLKVLNDAKLVLNEQVYSGLLPSNHLSDLGAIERKLFRLQGSVHVQ